MTLLSRLRLRTKLALLLSLSALAVVASVAAGSSLIHQHMIEGHVEKLRAVVYVAKGFAQVLEDQVAAGRLSREQALAQFRDDLHTMRFDGSNYVLVQTMDGVVVIHGGDPKREGKPTAAKDAQGRSSADLARELLAHTDEGTITYLVAKPGRSDQQPKLSFASRFAPWGLVFIAGDWTDDLDAAYRASLQGLGLIGGGILLIVLLAAWCVNRDIAGSLSSLKLAMERLASGELAVAVRGTERRDEVGAMAKALLVFKQQMQAATQLAAEQRAQQERAEQGKRAALIAMADTIESNATAALQDVGKQTAAMTTMGRGNERVSVPHRACGGTCGDCVVAGAFELGVRGWRGRTAQRLNPRDRFAGGAVEPGGQPCGGCRQRDAQHDRGAEPAGRAHRRNGRYHRRDCRQNQPAGSQRDNRGSARRGCRKGLCRRCLGSEGAGDTDRAWHASSKRLAISIRLPDRSPPRSNSRAPPLPRLPATCRRRRTRRRK